MERDKGVILAMLAWMEQNHRPGGIIDSHTFKIDGVSEELIQSCADLCVETGLVVSTQSLRRAWTGLTWAGYDLLEELKQDESVPELTVLDD